MTDAAPVVIPFTPAPTRRRLGEELIARGMIREADLANALTLQGQNGGLLGLNLVRLGAVSEAQLLDVLSEQLNLPILLPEHSPRPDQIAAFLAEIRSPLNWWAENEAVAWREEAGEDAPGRIVCAAVQPPCSGARCAASSSAVRKRVTNRSFASANAERI